MAIEEGATVSVRRRAECKHDQQPLDDFLLGWLMLKRHLHDIGAVVALANLGPRANTCGGVRSRNTIRTPVTRVARVIPQGFLSWPHR